MMSLPDDILEIFSNLYSKIESISMEAIHQLFPPYSSVSKERALGPRVGQIQGYGLNDN